MDTKDREGRTALFIAVTYGYEKTVDLLLRAGAEVRLACPSQPMLFRLATLQVCCLIVQDSRMR